MDEKKVLEIDLEEYIKGIISKEDIVNRAIERDVNLAFKSSGLMSSKDKGTSSKIMELIYLCNIYDIDVYVPVTSAVKGKNIVDLKKLDPVWYRLKEGDIVAEINHLDLIEGKIDISYVIELCKQKQASVLQLNNSPEKATEKSIFVLYSLIQAMEEHGITIYDPLEEQRAKDRYKKEKPTQIPDTNKLTDYKLSNINKTQN